MPEEGVDLVEDEELPDQEDCIKSGMLSRKSQGARGHWAPRFVILTSSELTFCKVSDEGRRSRLDWVPLDEIVSVNAREDKNEDGVLALDAGASMRDVNGLKRAGTLRHVDMDDDEDDKFSFLIQVCTCGAGTAPRITTRRRELAF